MLKYFKNKKLSTPVFVFGAVFSLVVFFVIVIIARLAVFGPTLNNSDELFKDKYYINTEYKEDDPYTTKVPRLRDIITAPIISKNDPQQGDRVASVVLVYFSDFECAYCRKQEQVLKQILVDYKYTVKLIWKDYPENNINSPSFQAAIAARCAQEQNQFWPYHDFLYELHKDLDRNLFIEIADLINLDIDQFNDCLTVGRTKKLIFENTEEADALGINGIPFLYVNDQEVLGEINYEDLKKMIELEIKKQ